MYCADSEIGRIVILQPLSKETFHDRVFENEMSKYVNAAAAAYDRMLFKEALKTGFYEMQASQ